MDPRLLNAAQTGNLELLIELIIEDELILEKVSLGSYSDTPLHIAAVAGKTDFAKEIIRRRSEFAKELNKDGFSPIHLASANGYIEIVKELLTQVGSYLCFLKTVDGRTALHCAVIKGRIEVIRELISTSPECIREITFLGETSLHLAVKNNQFEALKVLLQTEVCMNDDELLNAKDRDGNTLLHLAISKKQYQTIEYLLLNEKTGTRIEVNAKNRLNLTSMDVFDLLLLSGSLKLHDIEIREILRRVGGKSSIDLLTTQQVVFPPKPTITDQEQVVTSQHPDHVSIAVSQEPIISRAKTLLKDFSKEIYLEIDNSTSETRSALMVVAVLIATVTYQGGISPPGGVWQDNSNQNNSNTTSNTVAGGYPMHEAGRAIMSYQKACFILFMIFNTVGFFTSLVLITLLASKFPLKAWLRLSVISMATAFGCGVCFIASFSRCMRIILLLFFCGAVLGWYYWWLQKFAKVTLRRLNANATNQNFLRRIIQFIATGSFRPSNAVHDVPT